MKKNKIVIMITMFFMIFFIHFFGFIDYYTVKNIFKIVVVFLNKYSGLLGLVLGVIAISTSYIIYKKTSGQLY